VLFGVSAAWAQAPAAYSLTETNSMMGPKVTIHVYVDGNRAVSDQEYLNNGELARSRAYYDLQSHKTYGWNPADAFVPCNTGTFGGDWGDPFASSREMSADLAKQSAKETGQETVAGIQAKVMTVPSGKVWVDSKTGLLLKAVLGGQTIIEVTQYTPGKPAASIFELPASCSSAPAPATPAASADTIDAIMPPASKNTCAATIRVPGATRLSIDGVAKPLHNGEVHLAGIPDHFQIETDSAAALIYRQCIHPEMVLVLRNGNWLWLR